MVPVIEGCKIRIKTQGTQTVRICTEEGIPGKYKKCFRITNLKLAKKEMDEKVAKFSTIYDLETWLIKNQKAKYEPEKSRP
jgi:hypothetical protein